MESGTAKLCAVCAWPELVTAINGEAVSGKLYYQKKNEGKFRTSGNTACRKLFWRLYGR